MSYISVATPSESGRVVERKGARDRMSEKVGSKRSQREVGEVGDRGEQEDHRPRQKQQHPFFVPILDGTR